MHPAAVSAAKSIKNFAFNIDLPSKDNAPGASGDKAFVSSSNLKTRNLTPDTRHPTPET
jgi:hypothetical protein